MTVDLIYDGWVHDHLHYVTAHQQLVDEIELILRGGPPVVLMILGISGVGKTELLRDAQERFADCMTSTGRAAILYVGFPSGATSDAVAARIIKAILGIPVVKGTKRDLREQAIGLLKTSGIRVLILDEANHAAEAHSTRSTQTKANRLTADWIKEAWEDSKVSVVLSGLPHSRRLLTDNDQLEGRAMRPIELHPYAWYLEKDKESFGTLVEAFSGYAKANGRTVSMPLPLLTRATYLTSRGLVRPVKRLFERTALLKPRGGELTCDDFARTYDKCFSERALGNPFALKNITDEMLNSAHRELLQSVHEPQQKRGRKSGA